jgi:hypothetical protein
MLGFKNFIEETSPKGYTVDFYHHKHKKPIIHILKNYSDLEEAKKNPDSSSITGDEGYAHFGEFKPTNLDDSKQTVNEIHEHLARNGLYSASGSHPIHKDPHMQNFEDGIHEILGGKTHLTWHQDYPKARSKTNFAPRDAAVWSSSGSSTKLGKSIKNDKNKNLDVQEIPRATKPGTVTVFDDYTLHHQAPSAEERQDRHFIRVSDVRRIPKEGIPKKEGGFYDLSNKNDMESYLKSKKSNVVNGMHKKLKVKIKEFLDKSKNAQNGSGDYETRAKLINFINLPEHKDRFNRNNWAK